MGLLMVDVSAQLHIYGNMKVFGVFLHTNGMWDPRQKYKVNGGWVKKIRVIRLREKMVVLCMGIGATLDEYI